MGAPKMTACTWGRERWPGCLTHPVSQHTRAGYLGYWGECSRTAKVIPAFLTIRGGEADYSKEGKLTKREWGHLRGIRVTLSGWKRPGRALSQIAPLLITPYICSSFTFRSETSAPSFWEEKFSKATFTRMANASPFAMAEKQWARKKWSRENTFIWYKVFNTSCLSVHHQLVIVEHLFFFSFCAHGHMRVFVCICFSGLVAWLSVGKGWRVLPLGEQFSPQSFSNHNFHPNISQIPLKQHNFQAFLASTWLLLKR